VRDSFDRYILAVMSGARRGAIASGLRALMSAAEPVYRAIVTLRNHRFDAGTGVRRLPRPVVSIGNITAGGTGKTPVVRWLCEQLHGRGLHSAILMRGYKSAAGLSDEQRMLQDALADNSVIVRANPNRHEAANQILREHPEVDVFVLDDGFQHRRLARDFDLVLISATSPFGFGHVHPRGLLREPLQGLRRANAILITRADEVEPSELERIERHVRQWNTTSPIYHASHAHVGVRFAGQLLPLESLRGKRVFAFCGIADPASFFGQLGKIAAVVGSRAFGDHHAYRDEDVQKLDTDAVGVGADVMLTTEKDWTKLAGLPAVAAAKTPLGRVEMAIRFRNDDSERLLSQALSACPLRSPDACSEA
jgi:tetraacyldisaccharide 4'-kinase